MLEDVVQTEQGNSPKEIYLSSYGRISSEAFGGNYQLDSWSLHTMVSIVNFLPVIWARATNTWQKAEAQVDEDCCVQGAEKLNPCFGEVAVA